MLRRYWHIGGSFPSVYYNQLVDVDDQPFYAQGIVQAADSDEAYRLVTELSQVFANQLGETLPEAQIVVSAFGQGPPVVAPVAFRLVGPDLTTLRQWGERYRQVMAQHPAVLTTRATQLGGAPELRFTPDEIALRQIGRQATDLAQELQWYTDGAIAGQVFEGVQEIPVRVRLADQLNTIDQLPNMVLATGVNHPDASDSTVPLSAIATASYQPALGSLTRRNGERSNDLLAWIERGALAPDVTADILSAFDQAGLNLPTGYRLEIAGDSAESGEATGNLAAFAPVLLLFMIGVLILAFRSIALAALLGSVAIGAIGFGLIALRIADLPFGFNPLLGLAGLIGLALNDSIVVLAAIRAKAEARAGDIAGIIQASLSCGRHVVATTLTTIAGFLPLLIDGGTFWPPLAIVIAGGVIGASLLALVWVPSAYVLLLKIIPKLGKTT